MQHIIRAFNPLQHIRNALVAKTSCNTGYLSHEQFQAGQHQNPAAIRIRRTRFLQCNIVAKQAPNMSHHQCNTCVSVQHCVLHCLATEYAMLQYEFNDSVEQIANRRNLLQRLHRVRDYRPIRHHRSSGSLAHRVAREPPRACPTCHRYPILRGSRSTAFTQRQVYIYIVDSVVCA
jgi:hypothetical protein